MFISYGPVREAIARCIPMKRELKDVVAATYRNQKWPNCKVHPDEKGTERQTKLQIATEQPQNCKMHPDEKETERLIMQCLM